MVTIILHILIVCLFISVAMWGVDLIPLPVGIKGIVKSIFGILAILWALSAMTGHSLLPAAWG